VAGVRRAGGEVEAVADDRERGRTGGVRARPQIGDQLRALRRAVGAPQLLAEAPVAGREVDGAVEEPELAGMGVLPPGQDVGQQRGAGAGAVGAPQLSAVLAVLGGEERPGAEGRELAGPRARQGAHAGEEVGELHDLGVSG
jgi:hypothetical protein